MYRIVLVVMLLPILSATANARGGDFRACDDGKAQLARRMHELHGSDRTRRMIEADLSRADRAEARGDARECLDTIDHAERLLRDER